ncbi:MAG: hypothetical protein L0Y72_00765, partial [Gemmataceae bacterium]|nr:hypothetical protein [Gemmataceae bacterium]MCI0737542.1 hypothetical protein [Gemmataceae bacterium]
FNSFVKDRCGFPARLQPTARPAEIPPKYQLHTLLPTGFDFFLDPAHKTDYLRSITISLAGRTFEGQPCPSRLRPA